MSIKKLRKQLLNMILVVFLVFSSAFVAPSYAAVIDFHPFDSSNVMDDLRGADVFKDGFSTLGTSPGIINFVEFGYSYTNKLDYYGLFVYVYNPMRIDFDAKSLQNNIQMAITYNAEGKPSVYGKFDLKYCNKSEETLFKDQFFKFRILDPDNTIAQLVDRDARRYDVSGITMLTKGADTAEEYIVAGTYTFTGYSAGFGEDSAAESDLVCAVSELETVELDVQSTFFRTAGISALGKDHQNQLNSVYFAVDNRFFERYGKLQQIMAEWWEYKTKEIIVTEHQDFFDKIMPYRGAAINSNHNTSAAYMLFYNYVMHVNSELPFATADLSWNGGGFAFVDRYIDALYYLFPTDDIKSYDPYGTKKVVGGIAGNDLYDYIKKYNNTFYTGRLPVKSATISADLFLDKVDEGRQKERNLRNFDADIDLHDMLSYGDGKPSFWDKWKDFGFWNTIWGKLPEIDESYKNIPPIINVDSSELMGASADLSKKLLIRQEDIDDFKNYVTAAESEEKTVVLFRYATTDYFSGAADIGLRKRGFLSPNYYTDIFSGKAYIAQQTVFLDFDIIQLSFNRDGEFTVIPAVANPIDIISDVTPPTDFPEDNWWRKFWDWLKSLEIWEFILFVLGVVAGIGVVLLLAWGIVTGVVLKVIKFIFKFLWKSFLLLGKAILYIICFPFWLIYKFFALIFRRGKKQ